MKGFIIQIRFTKKIPAHFLSHRELMTVIERAIRRANIPVKMSEGYNPRPRISFPTALGLGIESDDEVIYLTLESWLSPQEILRRVTPQLIPGIEITKIEPICSNESPVVRGIEYNIIFTSSVDVPLGEKINSLMTQSETWLERVREGRTKVINVRKYIKSLQQINERNISLSIFFSPEGSVSPVEVLKALDLNLSSTKCIIRKTKTVLEEKPL